MTKQEIKQPEQQEQPVAEPTPEPTPVPVTEPVPSSVVEPTPEPVVAAPVAAPVAEPVSTGLPPEVEEWLNEKAIQFNQELETLIEWYLEEEKGFKELGISDDIPEDELIDFIESGVMSRLETEMGVPKKELDYICIGRYNQSPRGVGNVVSESVGYIIDSEHPEIAPRLALCQAWNKHIQKHSCFQLKTYKTKFGFDETQAQPDINGKCNISIEQSTNMIETQLDWISNNDKDKLDWIRSMFPVLSLKDAENNPSQLMAVKDKSYVNPADIRRIKVVVNSFKEGINKVGVPWGSYAVTDKTFTPTPQNKFFSVWIDPQIPHAIGCGDGSVVEIYGVIKRNYNSGIMEMDACAAFAIIPKPIEATQQNIMSQNSQALNQAPPSGQASMPPVIGGMEG